MDSRFNNDDFDIADGAAPTPPPEAADNPPVETATTVPSAGAPVADPVVPEAVIKFRSCRWRRPPEDGPECCGHRDVLPIAGTSSFDPAAWCPECEFFKLRRMPKKRAWT